MSVGDVVAFLRFQAFPFIPDGLKHRMIRQLFEMQVDHPALQMAMKPLLEANQFTRFAKTISHFSQKRYFHIPRHVDLELVEQFFWEETNEVLAARCVNAFLHFPEADRSIWNTATNLWSSARNQEDKEIALGFVALMRT